MRSLAEVLTTDHMADGLARIIDDHSEVVGNAHILPRQNNVASPLRLGSDNAQIVVIKR